jgi:hypothetical protein
MGMLVDERDGTQITGDQAVPKVRPGEACVGNPRVTDLAEKNGTLKPIDHPLDGDPLSRSGGEMAWMP